MKLIDLSELLFKPPSVQFEPCPWNGPMPDRWLHASWPDRGWSPPYNGEKRARLPVTRFQYSDRFVESVSAARIVSVPAGAIPLVNMAGEIVGWGRP